jgi:acyl dehydratase
VTPDRLDPERILRHPGVARGFRYTRRDTMLHALAIGVGVDFTDPRELAFTYDAALRAHPTFANALGWVDPIRDPESIDLANGIDQDRMVVAGLAMRLNRPLEIEGEGVSRTRYVEVVDKGPGKAGLVRARKELFDRNEVSIGTLDTWHYVRGAGGFGGTSAGGPASIAMPTPAPDASIETRIPTNAALLYRLSLGDHNAVHADPAYARRVGFDRPILHGLATFAIAVHAVLRGLADDAFDRFAGAEVRTTAPVMPGDTLVTSIWQSSNSVLFRATVGERVVLDAGRIELR